jgi:hypothetical protein
MKTKKRKPRGIKLVQWHGFALWLAFDNHSGWHNGYELSKIAHIGPQRHQVDVGLMMSAEEQT